MAIYEDKQTFCPVDKPHKTQTENDKLNLKILDQH